MKKAIVPMLLGLLTALGPAIAQDNAANQQPPGDQTIDQSFVQAAVNGDMYELTSSQMALEHAENEEVRALAQRLVNDHTATTQHLTSIAQQVGAQLPDELTATFQFKIAYLEQHRDEGFDLAYLEQQVVAHQLGVGLYEMAADSAEDQALRAFASETLPTLQEHLRMAQDLLQQVSQGQ
jgi:putative membrane protein